MNIAGLQYSLNYKALEIYISGCDGACQGCHNPELHNFEVGKPFLDWIPVIKNRFKSGLVDRLQIYGGEPLLQNLAELHYFLDLINAICPEIWLFTRFKKDQVPEYLLKYLTYLKTGAYLSNMPSYVCPITGITLASVNQRIYKLK